MNDRTPSRWDRFGTFVARHRWIFLGLAIGVTALSASFAPSVTMTTDATSYLPNDRPEVLFWRDMTRRFGGFDTLMVGLEEPEKPLTSDGLARLARITDLLAGMKAQGVLNARSVTNLENLREDEEGTLNAEMMIPSIPRSPEGLEALGQRILGDTQVPGVMVSRDLRAYVIILTMDPRQDMGTTANRIMDTVETERGPLNAYYFGAAFVTNQIGKRVYASLSWVVPIFAAGLFLVLLLWLRQPVASLMVLGCSGLPLLWWLGFLRLFDLPVTVAVLNGALLMLPVGAVAFGRAAEARLRGRVAPVSRRTAELLVAAAAAYGVLALLNRTTPDSLPYLAQFGEGMVVGFVAMLVFAIIGATPLLSFLPIDPRLPATSRPRRARAGRRTIGIALVFILAGASIFGAWRMEFAVTLRDLFSAREDTGAAVAFFDRRFGGADLIQVSVKGDFKDPAVVQRVMRLTDLLDGTKAFPDVRSIPQVLGFIAKGMAGTYWIPPDRDALATLWTFLEGKADVRPLVNDARDEAMVTLRIPGGGGVPGPALTETVRRTIEASAATGLPAARIRLESLARAYDVIVPSERTTRLLAAATGVEAAADSEARRRQILASLQEYMASGASPFTPSNPEWSDLAAVLAGPQAGMAERLAAVLPRLPSFREAGLSDDVAGRLAETLATQVRDREESLLSESLAAKWLEGLDPAKVRDSLRARVKGAFSSLIAGEPRPDKEPVFTISGFPALGPVVEAQLMGGLHRAVAVVLGVFLVLAILAGISRPGHLRAIPEAVIATLATFALGTALGLNVDSNSATLYLLPPTITWFLSPGLADPDGYHGWFPWAFAVAFAVAATSIAMIGVLPVVRLGAVMALGLLASAGSAALGSYLWEGPVQRDVPRKTP
jgi:hypothetical protein